jgi:hypothetical protein
MPLRLFGNKKLAAGAFGGPPKKPKPPIFPIIREDCGLECPKCGSTLIRKWLIFKTDKCIQPLCENYYGG